VDKHARWHQIQPFFKRLLQRHYKSLHRHDNVANKNYPSDILIAAVHCYLEHNKTALALELLLKLQDWPWLSSVLATVGPQWINDGDKKRQLYHCLIQIPQKLLSADPHLLMLLAKSYPDSMMRKEAPLVYSQAQHLLSKQLLAANNDKDIALETLQNLSKQYLDCILNQSLLLRSYEQYELALTLLENPEVETLLSGQAVLSTHLNKEIGVLYFMQGKMQQADTLLLASINTAKTLRIEEVLVFSSGYILMSHIEQGRLDEASNYISDLLIWLEDNNWNSLPIIQWLAVPHIVLLIEQNKLEQASELIHNIQHNFKHSIITQAVQFRMLHFIEAKLHLAREEFNQARQALKQMERFVPLAGNHNFGLRSSGALSVLLHIKTRQTTEVKKWLKENETSLLAGDDYSKEADRLTLARCYSYLGQFQDCATVIKEVRQRTSRKNQLKTLVKSYIIEALNFLAQKKQGHALKTMEKAVQLSLNTGFCGLFYEEGQTALELLQQLHASDIQTDAVSTLLTAMGTNKVMPPQASSPDLPEILSVRERQILQLMSKGDSNKDLADKLGIKEGTVKVHTSSIYRKLKVKNRSQAIAKIRG
jgi:ATP/maltotriose-dependent transcriptional regulator MalT